MIYIIFKMQRVEEMVSSQRRGIDVQPVFDEPALFLKSKEERVLAIADLHIGLKYQWEREGVFIPDQKKRLLEKIRRICVPMKVSRLIIIGDFKHHVPKDPWEERKVKWEAEKEEWEEKLNRLFKKRKEIEERIKKGSEIKDNHKEALYKIEKEKMRYIARIRERRNEILDKIPSEEEAVNLFLEELSSFLKKVDIVKGNHDGRLENIIDPSFEDFVTVHRPEGFIYRTIDKLKYNEDAERDCLFSVGFFHGHKWPDAEVVASDLIVVGHTHYSFLFEDRVGARVIEPVWLRGEPTEKMKERYPVLPKEFILMPSFNPLLSTKPINTRHPTLYGPLLKNRYLDINNAKIYLFDGTLLGRVRDFKWL